MESCRNVLIEFVQKETHRQVQNLGTAIRDQYNLNEVVAYALNRLPPMFSATERDLHQKRQECLSMRADITKVIRQALLAVRRDPLRQIDPLADIELANAPYALQSVQDLLGWQNLVWSDLPKALEDGLERALIKSTSGNSVLKNSPLSGQRQLLQRDRPNRSYLIRPNLRSTVDPKTQSTYDLYRLEAQPLVHSLERLAIKMAQNHAQKFSATELKFIRLEEVLAKAFNQLPPLYATSTRGINYLRYHAQMNIGSELALIIHEAMIEVRNANYSGMQPLMFSQIRCEREQALIMVDKLLGDRQVKWQNLIEVVTQSLELAKQGQICWQRSTATANVS